MPPDARYNPCLQRPFLAPMASEAERAHCSLRPSPPQVGFWAGQVLRCHGEVGPVILGQDSRSSSDMLASGLAAGFKQRQA